MADGWNECLVMSEGGQILLIPLVCKLYNPEYFLATTIKLRLATGEHGGSGRPGITIVAPSRLLHFGKQYNVHLYAETLAVSEVPGTWC